MKFNLARESSLLELKRMATTLSTAALDCAHNHQSCLLYNGNRLADEGRICETVADGAKLILFLRHHHNCVACSDSSSRPCTNGRHVAVIIAEDLAKGVWNLRVVGGDKQDATTEEEGIFLDKDNTDKLTSQHTWTKVRQTLSTLHGEYAPGKSATSMEAADERQQMQQEILELRRQQQQSEADAAEKSRLLRLKAEKEAELRLIALEAKSSQAKAEQELRGAKEELEKLQAEVTRSRSTSSSSLPEGFQIYQDPPEAPQEPAMSCSAPESSDMLDLLADQVDKLQRKMDDEVKRTGSCSVCMARPFVWVYKCGHAKCDDCAVELQKRGCKCPECREPLEDPRRLFWATNG